MCPCPLPPQLIVADQPLALNLATTMDVYGTFMMGSPSCPIQSRITVTIPGGNATYGVDVWPGGQYDVHGVVQVGARPDHWTLWQCTATLA